MSEESPISKTLKAWESNFLRNDDSIMVAILMTRYPRSPGEMG
jgi:hypothetical protein